MSAAIRIHDLSKLYRIGGPSPLGRSFREDATRWLRRMAFQSAKISAPALDKLGNENGAAPPGCFWALRDITLEVEQGQVLGIVGRNGAGKSTLLKILARITPPTTGKIHYRGRLGSLLEIGTGFHRELSGRENVFLNGSILGMRRDEVGARLDEIVAFAEVNEFIDTPVKFYSSGMYVRLAFAVAAHLDTDILLVDEVLAVGDVRFQKKCLGKIENAARNEGRTVLFVSHNMNAVQRLCSHGVFMDEGRIVRQGNASEIAQAYLSASNFRATTSGMSIDLTDAKRFGSGEARFASVRYTSDLEENGFQPYPEGPVEFSMVVNSSEARTLGSVAVTFYSLEGMKLVNADTISLGKLVDLHPGDNEIRLKIKQLHLNAGSYVLGLYLADPLGAVVDHIESAFEITVVDRERNKYGRRPVYDGSVSCDFEIVEVKNADRRAHG